MTNPTPYRPTIDDALLLVDTMPDSEFIDFMIQAMEARETRIRTAGGEADSFTSNHDEIGQVAYHLRFEMPPKSDKTSGPRNGRVVDIDVQIQAV